MKRILALIGYAVAFVFSCYLGYRTYAYGEVFLCVNRAIHAESTIGMDRSEIWSWCRDNHLNPFSFFQ